MTLTLTIFAVLGGIAALAAAVRMAVRGPKLAAFPLGYLAVVAFTWALLSTRSEGYRPKPAPDETAAGRPTEEPMHDYVSSDTCRSCHPGEYHSWHASYHRTMTQLATEEAVKGNFDSGHVAEFPGMNVRFSRDDEGFWATYAFPNANGAGYRAVEKRRIVMTTGSHHYQVYWTADPWTSVEASNDRDIWLVPSVYLFDEQQWIPRQASFLIPPHDQPESHRWNQSCVACHSTHGIKRLHPELEASDTRTVEFGISCEACHGPGREHVEANRDPLRRYGLHRQETGDPTIVNPAKLDKQRSAEVCGQCHSVNIPPSTEISSQWNRTGKTYRPGQNLHEVSLVIHPGGEKGNEVIEQYLPHVYHDRFWSDGMVRVAGREYHGLLETPCFQRGEMTCLSCHTMHKDNDDTREDLDWANDQLISGMRGNAACTQCHEALAEPAALSGHTHHGAGSAGSNCYNCHMPHTTYGLLKGIRSHQINSPSVQSTLDTGRPNACNLCHLNQTLAWTADHLETWFRQPRPSLSPDQETISASILDLLTGDAGQRALAASAMGRPDPQAVSGTDWMAPFLAQLHFDPYQAVQIISNKSLRTIEGFAGLPRYPKTPEGGKQAYQQWKETRSTRNGEAALLINTEGKVDQRTMLRLFERRDNSPVNLRE